MSNIHEQKKQLLNVITDDNYQLSLLLSVKKKWTGLAVSLQIHNVNEQIRPIYKAMGRVT